MSIATRDTAYVYFIQAGDEPAVKVGSTIHSLESRLLELQTANHRDLRLIGAIQVRFDPEDGYHTRRDVAQKAMRFEREIQRQFAADCIRGEWFNLTDELRAFIRLRSNIGSR